MSAFAFAEEARRAVYEVIGRRRDIRHFRAGAPLDDEQLSRILGAAHQAPSVGYSQPWDFVVVREPERRERIRDSFLKVRAAEAVRFPAGERREQYLSYKLEGILDSALNLCVTVDLRPADEVTLGTTAQPEALRWSACCAVQNLWLAARAEGIGVGWVSIVEPAVLRRELGLPPGIEPVAYLCLGEPIEFRDRPLLEESGWRARRPLADAVHRERYRAPDTELQTMAPAERPPAASAESIAPAASAESIAPSASAGGIAPSASAEGIAPSASAEGIAPSASAESIAPSASAEGIAPSASAEWRPPAIAPASEEARAAARAQQSRLCKPRGSLGRLEELAVWYAGARGRFPLAAPRAVELYVFAADHGLTEHGVSAYSSTVTAAMVGNLLAGGAAASVLARGAGIALTVVDVGVAGDLSALPQLDERRARFIAAKLGAGSADATQVPALSRLQATAALDLGARLAGEAARSGCELLCAGELGIGNSSAAAALLCALGGTAPAEVVGRGTGLDDAGRAQKVAVVERMLARHQPRPDDPLGALISVGGLELAALAGLLLGGAAVRLPIVVDGFIAGAAALVASKLAPAVRDYLVLSHRSAEQGADRLAAALGLTPLLDLGLRLGEGTGAVLAADLVRQAVRAQHEMATFSTSGVADRVRTGDRDD